MANWFDKDYYLDLKMLQLDATGQRNGIQDDDGLERVLRSSGMTPEAHYLAYGHSEGLNPNAYFNETEYLSAKLAQLQEDPASGWGGKSINELRSVIASTGLTAVQHYEMYGAYETRADGTLLNPSNGFDANGYMQAKLVQMQLADPATRMSVQDVVNTFKAMGLSPMSHALLYGQDESDWFHVNMIQTVPDAQRVAADPGRWAINSTVPGNSAAPSAGPSAVVTPRPVDRPFDMDDVNLPDPLPVAPTPPTPTPPAPLPGLTPTPPAYGDLIGIERDWNSIEFDVNDDSPAYWSLFGPYVENGVVYPGRVFEHTKVRIEVRADLDTLVIDASGVRAAQLDIVYRLEGGADVKLMDARTVTVPVGTIIDVGGLSDDDWGWQSYDVTYKSSGVANAGDLIVAGDDITFKLPHSQSGSAVGFDRYNNWSTAGVVEVVRYSRWSAREAQTLDEAYMADDERDSDTVDLVGVPQDAGVVLA